MPRSSPPAGRAMSSRRRGTGGPPAGRTGLAQDPPLRREKPERTALLLPAFPAPGQVGPPPADREEFGLGPSGGLRGGSPSAMERIPRRRISNALGLGPAWGKSSDAISSRWSACRTRSQSSTIPQKLRLTEAEERTAIRPGRSVHAMSRRTYRCSSAAEPFPAAPRGFPDGHENSGVPGEEREAAVGLPEVDGAREESGRGVEGRRITGARHSRRTSGPAPVPRTAAAAGRSAFPPRPPRCRTSG